MIEPHLARAERSRRGEVLARNDIVSIGGPLRAVQQPEALLRDRPWARSVAVHYPDVVAAAAVGRESDLASARGVARLHVPRVAGRNRVRLAAGNRHYVDVPQHVEYDLPPVGG